MAVSHIKSNTVGDFTGTITGFNSQGSTVTIAATDLVRPVDWNSAHNQFYTLTGNTTGNSTASGTNVLFAGSGGISIGGSTGSLVFSAPMGQTFAGFHPYRDREYLAGQFSQGSLVINPIDFPNVQFDRVVIPINNTNSSNSSGSHTLSFWVGLYTQNASTLSLEASTSHTIALTHSGTAGSYSLYSGMRLFTIPMTTTLSAAMRWLAFISRTTSGGANGSYSHFVLSNLSSNFLGLFSVAHNTTQQYPLGRGAYSATTSGLPASIGFTAIRGSAAILQRQPVLYFGSGTV